MPYFGTGQYIKKKINLHMKFVLRVPLVMKNIKIVMQGKNYKTLLDMKKNCISPAQSLNSWFMNLSLIHI